MKLHECDSTLISRYGYEPDSRLMDIEFKRGGVYRYRNVAPATFHEFLRTYSKGRYFLSNIKYRHECEKIA